MLDRLVRSAMDSNRDYAPLSWIEQPQTVRDRNYILVSLERGSRREDAPIAPI